MEIPDLAHLLVSALAQCLRLAQIREPGPIAHRGPELSEEPLLLLVELGRSCPLRRRAALERCHTRRLDAKSRPFFPGLYLPSSSREPYGSGRSRSPHLALHKATGTRRPACPRFPRPNSTVPASRSGPFAGKRAGYGSRALGARQICARPPHRMWPSLHPAAQSKCRGRSACCRSKDWEAGEPLLALRRETGLVRPTSAGTLPSCGGL